MSAQLERIEKRVDEVYDRVSELKSEVHNLKWRVGAIASAVSSAITLIGAWIVRHL